MTALAEFGVYGDLAAELGDRIIGNEETQACAGPGPDLGFTNESVRLTLLDLRW